ncbi:centrosomal protein of 152 kDa isoform X2 [Syngnathoides biaculeatus]|uniref:centrosomal protein of 152 kDa isoform X2 n=1 Tax=Syngnathoides biaculeatus TaxID=300417 RepID=UPI002ADE8B50|nr:centrosomal protein of 152 kDa isoform X2 [Syngnathoides biaculeatus]
MSIEFTRDDFRIQHDEEECDEDDHEREQELKRRMDEMSDDLLEDDEYISSAEEESSICSNKSTGTSPQSKWTRQQSKDPRPPSNEQSYEADYNQQSRGFASEDGGVQINGHQRPAQPPPPDRIWNQQSQDWQFTQSGAVERHVEDYTARYNPHVPPRQMLNSQTTDQDGPFDQLQRVFLDSTQQTAEKEQLAQLQILNKAHQRQIEDLEKKLEDSKRKSRYLEHQLAVLKDEKNGYAASLKESSRHHEEAKERAVKLQSKVKALEEQIQTLIARDQENTKKQRVAEAAVDSMKQQMLELCHSDTLTKAREQHDRDVTVIKEQHEAALLVLQEQLDARSQALDEQMDTSRRFREQVKQLERQREEEQLDRGRVVNALTQRLEESQQQCAKLLETSSVQEMSKIQIQLQQAQAAKVLNEDMNRVLQEDLADLKEQIMLYESALKHGVIALDMNGDCENQLSESYLSLGLKKTTFKNGSLHSMALANLSDSKLPEDETLRQLKVELQRCLGCLKAKRQKFSRLQEELQLSRAQVTELHTQLDEAKLSLSVRKSSQLKHPNCPAEDQNELVKLKEDKKCLQAQVEAQENKIIALQQSEEKVRSANLEVRVQMEAMIKEFDQERKEAVERSERIHQQHWDDVVNRVRTELTLEHKAQVEYLTAQHEQHTRQLNTQLSEANDKLLDVQDCYIALCKEKDLLEEKVQNREREDALRRGNEKREESSTNIEKLKAEMEAQHQASITQLKVFWSKEKEAEIQQQVNSQVALAKAAWDEEHHRKEMIWTRRLEEARREKQSETTDRMCQTEERQQLQVEAEKVKHQAVEEAKKQVQKETHDKHLEDLASQVEGAVTRAYNRWIEDLTSLPEYQASLQTEKENWEELQKEHMEQKVTQALRAAEEQWQKQQKEQKHGQISGTAEELQEKLVTLQCQLEQLRREQAALLKAELGGARAAWKREKQQEISVVQSRSDQMYQSKLQEQHKKLELALLQAREETDLQKKEVLLQMEAKLKKTIRAKEDEWRFQQAEKEHALRRQLREDFLAELQTGLAEVQTHLLGSSWTVQQSVEESERSQMSEGDITHMIQSCCIEIVEKAVSQAKKDWKKISEAQLSCVLRETQEQHEREIDKMQNSLAQMAGQACSRKECADTTSKMQKKNQELQKHLEKACRQFQHSVREHKTTMQKLKDEHESRLQKAKEEHLLQLEEVKLRNEAAGTLNHQQNLKEGLEEMKQQYLMTVEEIKGNILRYVRESHERAAEMIRTEVRRERQDTARKMRHYYLTCLQELLEDSGKTTGAEKKIMNAASKLAAMAKVLETPVKNKSGTNRSLPTCMTVVSTTGHNLASVTDFSNPSILDRMGDRTQREKMLDMERKTTLVQTKHANNQDVETCESSADAQVCPHKVAPLRNKTREVYLQGGQPDNHFHGDPPNKPSLTQEVPVRDAKLTRWYLSSSESDDVQIPRLPYSERKAELAKAFCDLTEFACLTPDASDLTVYNDIAQETKTQMQTLATKAKVSTHREPTPGSEGEKQRGVCTGLLFSELRQQQDSGFDSPFNNQNEG